MEVVALLMASKICVPDKRKSVNFKVFNMLTKINEAKKMIKHIPCNCKCEFNSTDCNSNQEWNNKTCQCKCENDHKCKKYYSCKT